MIRGLFLFSTVGSLLLAAAGNLLYFALEQAQPYRQQAERQQTAAMVLPALRGEILDCTGRTLAKSVRKRSLFADPGLIHDPAAAAATIAPFVGLKPLQIEQVLRERADRRFAWIKRGLTDAEVAAFEAFERRGTLVGFELQHEPAREYPLARTAAHVLGFVGHEQHGLAGIEQSCDRWLMGVDGLRQVTVDVRRRRIGEDAAAEKPARDGATVMLTLDAHLQQRTEAHLKAAVDEAKAEWGCAVLMDPHSGEILAMAVYPDFDPMAPFPASSDSAQRSRAEERIRNRAVADAFEPGSVFKPFVASKALDERLVRLDEMFSIAGPARNFGRRTIHDTHAYSALALYEIISKSSNIGMALVGARCGNQKLFDFVRDFGFGQCTGVELPGEHQGIVLNLPDWTAYSTQSIPMGQEISVTPLQLATAFCVLANDGILYRPRIVRGVVGPDEQVLWDNSQPIAVRRVLRSETNREFRLKALTEVVRSGTGTRAKLDDYQVFGKTGTAQIAAKDRRGYAGGQYVGSFVGGAPAEFPRLVAVVSIYRPSGAAYYGGTIAAPAVGAILADALHYLHVPPDGPATNPLAAPPQPNTMPDDDAHG